MNRNDWDPYPRFRSGRTRTGRTRSGRTRPGRNADQTKKQPVSLDERIRRYIAACPESIAGEHGNWTLFRVAGQLRWGFDLSDGDLLRWLRLYNQTKCRPPWSERDLKAQVKHSAQRRKHVPRGKFLTAYTNRK
jgi:hypothetical protein